MVLSDLVEILLDSETDVAKSLLRCSGIEQIILIFRPKYCAVAFEAIGNPLLLIHSTPHTSH